MYKVMILRNDETNATTTDSPREIYVQTVQDLNLEAVIKAVNGIGVRKRRTSRKTEQEKP